MAEVSLLDGRFDTALLSRIEDAGINASAPPQQLWQDGWLIRFSPGKAKRARCINSVAVGRLSLDDKLRLANAALDAVRLPLIVRITPFSQPPGLDGELADRGFMALDDTRVMVCTALPDAHDGNLPPGLSWVNLDSATYADAVGALRGSPSDQRRAHAQRLQWSPVPYRGIAIQRDADGAVVACGQVAQEADMAGLYDVFTRETARAQGLGRLVCLRLLAMAAESGATVGYLQVESSNAPARRVYQRLGFSDAYSYHYRQAPAAAR